MKKYTCEYKSYVKVENGKRTAFKKKILALDHQSAYEEFLRQTVVADSEVLVTAGLGIMADTQTFDDHRKSFHEKEEIAKQQEYETTAKKYTAQLANFTNRSYLSLSPKQRIYFSQFFDYLAAVFESRALTENEILYINSWLSFQDRQLGESLILKRLSNLPKDLRDNSQFSKLIMIGFVGSAMRNDQALGQVTDQLESIGEDVESISEDVEDVNEGFGFDE
jgi:hypothetical protein